MIHLSVNINGIDMLNTYRMALKDRHCVQPPVPKTFYQDVPGADGSLDLSTANTGHILYERRDITMNFGCKKNIEDWPVIFSEILRLFHGKEGKIIFDDDPGYYYIGRMEVTGYERARRSGTFTITVKADPYKYEMVAGDEDWLWDPFNLDTGIIREYKGIVVNRVYDLDIIGTEKWIIPDIIVSADMQVIFDGKTYQLKTGTNKLYDIVIKPGINTLRFIGPGTVTVRYRGAIL